MKVIHLAHLLVVPHLCLWVLVHWGHVRTLGHRRLLCDRAVLVCQEQSLQVHNFFPELSHLTLQSIVLRLIYINFSLQISEPLLLALATFQSGNTAS